MSKLYGSVQGDEGTAATRRAFHDIEAWVQTTRGRVTVRLNDDGEFEVRLSPVVAYQAVGWGKTVAKGTVNNVMYDDD